MAIFSEDLAVMEVRGFVIGLIKDDGHIMLDSNINHGTQQQPILPGSKVSGYLVDKLGWLFRSWIFGLISHWPAGRVPASWEPTTIWTTLEI